MDTRTREAAVKGEVDRWAEAFRATSAAAISRMATEYVDQKEELRKARERVSAMEKALQQVADWGPFPRVPSTTEGGPDFSYGTAYGSSGERDFIRKIAADALKAK
jgi:hypothetical protein